MPRPPIDLKAKVLAILDHVGDMPEEASSPLAHYTLGANAAITMRKYFVRRVDKEEHYAAVRQRHLHLLDNMMIVNMVQLFERFIKDLASVCVDHLCDRVIDNRFDTLTIRGGFVAAHFKDSSPGRALCESDTWLSCKDINDQFKSFLRDPLAPPNAVFHIFPPHSEEFRMMSIVWQLRHTIVHNVGVITRSDATKLQVLAKRQLPSPRVLLPEWDDIRFLKAYLDQRARDINTRVGNQLATVLSSLLSDNPALFLAQEEANSITAQFGFPLTVTGAVGVLPP